MKNVNCGSQISDLLDVQPFSLFPRWRLCSLCYSLYNPIMHASNGPNLRRSLFCKRFVFCT